MNVALYGAKRRWAMTERGEKALMRDANTLRIGPSSMQWNGKALYISLDEVTAPLPSRIRGSIILTPEVHNRQSFELSEGGEHCWWPLAPRARIEVDLPMPGVRWSGDAYLDCNWGEAPLEKSFRHWSWSRTQCPDGSSEIFYDVVSRDRYDVHLALRVGATGVLEEIKAPDSMQLPRTLWHLERPHRLNHDDSIRFSTALEDGPFYSRTLIGTAAHGQTSNTVHESLSLERFSSLWVQAMLPFRMPRSFDLVARALTIAALVNTWWRGTITSVATNRRLSPDNFHYYESDADAKNRQHLDQPKMISHGVPPWFRIDLQAEALIELFLRLEQRDAAIRRGAQIRSRV